MHTLPCLAAGIALLAAALPAQQDAIGVTFTGQIVVFDSYTGAGGLLTTSILTGQNALARVGTAYYTTDRVQPPGSTGFTYSIDSLTPVNGATARILPNVGDMRGLAADPANSNFLWGLRDGQPDVLCHIRLSDGQVTPLGPSGRTGVQALTDFQGQILGWDLAAGLIRFVTNSGATVDVNPAVGTNGAVVQFLMVTHDGRLLGGQQDLYQIDPVTGVPTLLGPLCGGAFDVRGAEQRVGIPVAFGSGCAVPAGGNATLAFSGNPRPGGTLAAFSNGHQPGHAGVTIVGFGFSSTPSLTLPLPLDPLLGTVGCALQVQPDVLLPRTTTASGSLLETLAVPAAAVGMMLCFQQAVFENVPGGMSWTGGGLAIVVN